MWLIFRFILKKFVKPFINFKNFLKKPFGTFGRKLNNGINVVKKAKNTYRKANKIVNRVNKAKMFSKTAKIENEILKKATLIDQLINEENEILANKTSASITTTKTVEEIVETEKILKTKTYDEKEKILSLLNKELDNLGLKSEEDITQAIDSDEFFYEKAMQNSHREFMENWKNGFFAYNPADLGMSEDERDII